MGIENIDDMKDESATANSGGVVPSPEAEAVPATPTAPTTSPDVVITHDPGPAPTGDVPPDDGSTQADQQPGDPASDDAVDPLAEDSGDPNVIPIATEENPSA